MRLIQAGFLALLLPAASFGDSWPEFRGPTQQGIVRAGRLPIEWGPNRSVGWKAEVPGNGWSSPAVNGGRVYLTAAVPVSDGQSLRALCIDAGTGKTVWNKEVFREEGKSAPHPKNSHASPTPIVKGDRLYVHFGHEGTACLDLAGDIRWRNRDLRFAPVHGNGGSPALVDDVLIFSGDGAQERFVAALDCDTGRLRWRTDRSGEADMSFSFSTPLAITVNGRKQVVSPGSNMVSALDPRTGREIWRVRYHGYSVIPRPVFGHGLVYVCTGFNSPSLLAIRPDGEGDVTETHVAWSARTGVPHTPSPLLVGDELFLVSDQGSASCLDARTGKVHWRQSIGGNYSASPLWADGKIYVQSEEGIGTVLSSGKKFEILARNDLRERTLASYAAADGALFIRTAKHLYRIDSLAHGVGGRERDKPDQEPARPAYRVLGQDRGHVAIVNASGTVEWEYAGPAECHDLWLLANGNILMMTQRDMVAEVNPDKKIVWSYTSKPKKGYRGHVEVHAFQRLANGLTMIAESGNARIIEVDREGKIVTEIRLTVEHPDAHRDTRMARKLDTGHYLVCHEGDAKVREYAPSGKVVWTYALDLGGRPRSAGHGPEGHGTEVFGAIRLPTGNTLIAAGNGNRVIEVTPEGKIVWSIGHDELPGIRLAWVTTLQLLPNGNLIVGNCHAGPENPQLFEVTRDKKVVWTFKNFKTFGDGLAAAQVLDVEGRVIR